MRIPTYRLFHSSDCTVSWPTRTFSDSRALVDVIKSSEPINSEIMKTKVMKFDIARPSMPGYHTVRFGTESLKNIFFLPLKVNEYEVSHVEHY